MVIGDGRCFHAEGVGEGQGLPIYTDILSKCHLQQGDAVFQLFAVQLAFVLLKGHLELIGRQGKSRIDGSCKILVQGIKQSVKQV